MHRLRRARHVFNAPLSEAMLDTAIAQLKLPKGARVLDIGCGYGEELLRTACVYEIEGVGVDIDEEALKFGEELIQQQYRDKLKGTVKFEHRKWQDASADGEWDAIFCIGATQAFGSVNEAFRNTLTSTKKLLKPGGKLLLGDLYWRKIPSKEYLTTLECDTSSYGMWQEDVQTARDVGFGVVGAWECSLKDFDQFEEALWAAAEQMALNHPSDVEKQTRWNAIKDWRDIYIKEGRETLGFGLYLLQQ